MTYACVAEWKSIQVMKIPKNTISNTGTLNPFTPKISLIILLTICHTILIMLVQRIWY